MTVYVLDTDIMSLLQLRHPTVLHRASLCGTGQLTISVISVEEQISGWYRRIRQAQSPEQIAKTYQRLADSVTMLSQLLVLNYSVPAIHRYDSLRKQVRNVRKMDLRLAAIVLEHGATLVTRNRTDFQRVPGLTIEDWSQ